MTDETVNTGGTDAQTGGEQGGGTPPAPPAPPAPPTLDMGALPFDVNSVEEAHRGSLSMFIKDGKLNLPELVKSHASAQSLIGERQSLPKTPEGYFESELSLDVEGEKHVIDPKDPMMQAFAKGAHQAGLSRKDVTAILGQVVPYMVAQDKAEKARVVEMASKLSKEDVDFITNRFGELKNSQVLTDGDVQAIEGLSSSPEAVTAIKKLLSHTGTSVTTGDGRMTQQTSDDVQQQLVKLLDEGKIAEAQALAQQHNAEWVPPSQSGMMVARKRTPEEMYAAMQPKKKDANSS